MPHLARTSWDFADGCQGWYRNPYGTQTIWAHDGVIEFFRTFAQRTPVAIRTRPKPFAAAPFKAFRVRLRLKPTLLRGDKFKPKGDEVVRLMWSREDKPILQKDGSADISSQASAKAVLDGEWHEYELPLADNANWTGTITELWFDPSDLLYVNAEIDWMRFE